MIWDIGRQLSLKGRRHFCSRDSPKRGTLEGRGQLWKETLEEGSLCGIGCTVEQGAAGVGQETG